MLDPTKRLSPRALQELAITFEVCGTSVSEVAAQVIEQELAGIDEDALITALHLCRREVEGRLSLAAILKRIVVRPQYFQPRELQPPVPTEEEQAAIRALIDQAKAVSA